MQQEEETSVYINKSNDDDDQECLGWEHEQGYGHNWDWNQAMYDDMNIEKNRLVLYVEEVYTTKKTDDVDMKCFIIYDNVEEEYFLCGSRRNNSETQYGDFKFFCKSKTDIINFISFIFNVKESDLNYGLYNYSTLSSIDNSHVTFDKLDNMRLSCSEIALYEGMDYSYLEFLRLLNMIKKIRF
jgi:hypothetical protein